MNIDIIQEAKNVFDTEIAALKIVEDSLGDSFKQIFNLIIECKGKVIFTGMGKPGHIAKKISATFSSVDIPSIFLHPAEAQHGDLGVVQANDLVIAISYSGESTEITKILPNIKLIGATLIGVTGNGKSTLAKKSDIVQTLPKFEEAGYLKLAPTSSTTAVLVYFDAMAVVVAKSKKFTENNFALYHPSGLLGKKLLMEVKDLMVVDPYNAVVSQDTSLRDAISEMCSKPIGLLNVVDNTNKLLGIITDGDIRRALYAKKQLETTLVSEIMTINPVSISSNVNITIAFSLMVEKKVQCIPVIENGEIVGTLQLKDILSEGINL